MRGGRRVDMMSTLVKGDQEILHLEEHPKGQCLGDFPRGRMHIDTEIEEVEEDPMETSDD
jgi:hypothetical protein